MCMKQGGSSFVRYFHILGYGMLPACNDYSFHWRGNEAARFHKRVWIWDKSKPPPLRMQHACMLYSAATMTNAFKKNSPIISSILPGARHIKQSTCGRPGRAYVYTSINLQLNCTITVYLLVPHVLYRWRWQIAVIAMPGNGLIEGPMPTAIHWPPCICQRKSFASRTTWICSAVAYWIVFSAGADRARRARAYTQHKRKKKYTRKNEHNLSDLQFIFSSVSDPFEVWMWVKIAYGALVVL